MHEIAVLGCTGSIGTQALSMIDHYPDRFRATVLTAHSQADELFRLVRKYRPKLAVLTGGEVPLPEDVKHICDWAFGPRGLIAAAEYPLCDTVLAAVVGIAGMDAVIAAGRAGKRVLLANKESLVAGGEIVMRLFGGLAGGRLLPVDSEHSAIFQSMLGREGNDVDEILLTASGGPFRTWPKEKMLTATVEEALGHPNWSMGAKITVDSATMFNKGLEIIEARWLFDIPQERIRVLVHPQSIVHSAVRYKDGAVIAQMGIPDMKLPILFAMAYPERLPTFTPPLDLTALGQLTFEEPDNDRFPAIALARRAISEGGTAPTVMNAANETAVAAFLEQRIAFGQIYPVVRETMERVPACPVRDASDIHEADEKARRAAAEMLR